MNDFVKARPWYIMSQYFHNNDSTPQKCDSPLHILQRPRIDSLDKESHLRQIFLSHTAAVQPCWVILIKFAPLSVRHSIVDSITSVLLFVKSFVPHFGYKKSTRRDSNYTIPKKPRKDKASETSKKLRTQITDSNASKYDDELCEMRQPPVSLFASKYVNEQAKRDAVGQSLTYGSRVCESPKLITGERRTKLFVRLVYPISLGLCKVLSFLVNYT